MTRFVELPNQTRALFVPLLLFLHLVSCSQSVKPEFHGAEMILAQALGDWRPLSLRLRSDLYGSTIWHPQSEETARQRRVALAGVETRLKKTDPLEPHLVQALALLHLIWGGTHKAMALLDEALERHPKHAGLVNALAVTYFRHGQVSEEGQYLARALETISEAAAIQNSPEICFNHALILQELNLTHEAINSWKNYLDMDRQSPWRVQATENLGLLKSPLPQASGALEGAFAQGEAVLASRVVSDPKAAQDFAEQVLLPGWAQASTPEAAQESLDKLTVLAQLIFQNLGDRALLDEANRLQQKPYEEREILARGHRLLHESFQAYQSFKVEKSRALLAQASELLEKGRSPFRYKAFYYQAVNLYRSGDLAGATERLSALEADLPEAYLELRARSLWMLGLIHQFGERPIRARYLYEQSRSIFEKLGHGTHLGGIHNRLSEVYYFLGEFGLAWQHNQTARQHTIAIAPGMTHYIVDAWAAEMAREQGLNRAALHFQNQALAVSRILEEPLTACLALVARARILGRLSLTRQARTDLTAARTYLPQQPPTVWQGVLARLNLTEALQVPPSEALPLLEEALEQASKTGLNYLAAQIYLARAQVHRALGSGSQAEEDLKRGIQACERVTAKLPSKMEQRRFLEARRNLFDAMIQFQALEQNQPSLALAYGERMRARTLKQQVMTHQPDGDLPTDLDHLPAHVALLFYVVQPKHLLAWMVRAGEIHFFQLPVSQKQLEMHIAELNETMNQRGSVRKVSGLLYDILLQPMAHLLHTGDSLIFLPDRQLHQVPFAALFDATRERYLIQDFRIGSAPSIGIYQLSLARDADRANSKHRALLVGNPSFDPQLFPMLRSLPYAEQEARDIAVFYPSRHRLLLGARATREAVINAAPQFTIFHFGGHALTNKAFPSYSRLVLASQPGVSGEGALGAGELAAMDFHRTRLVILAACGSAAGKLSTSEGPLSLARAFLAGGVSAVLSSPEDVQDRLGAAFFKRYHQFLSRGNDALTALCLTQRSMLESGDSPLAHPSAWASFRLLGGVNETGRSLGK